MRVHYLNKAQWEPEWIENAVDIAVSCWTEHYCLEKKSVDGQDTASTSQFAYSVSVCMTAIACAHILLQNFLDQMFMTMSSSELQGDAACCMNF